MTRDHLHMLHLSSTDHKVPPFMLTKSGFSAAVWSTERRPHSGQANLGWIAEKGITLAIIVVFVVDFGCQQDIDPSQQYREPAQA